MPSTKGIELLVSWLTVLPSSFLLCHTVKSKMSEESSASDSEWEVDSKDSNDSSSVESDEEGDGEESDVQESVNNGDADNTDDASDSEVDSSNFDDDSSTPSNYINIRVTSLDDTLRMFKGDVWGPAVRRPLLRTGFSSLDLKKLHTAFMETNETVLDVLGEKQSLSSEKGVAKVLATVVVEQVSELQLAKKVRRAGGIHKRTLRELLTDKILAYGVPTNVLVMVHQLQTS